MQRASFSLIRYAHQPTRGEYLNIGVIFRCDEAPFLMARFSAQRIHRLGCMDSDADFQTIRLIEQGITRAVKVVKKHQEKMEILALLVLAA